MAEYSSGSSQVVAAIVEDPNKAPDVVALRGMLGEAATAERVRLYLSVNLDDYLEFDRGAIVHQVSIPETISPLDEAIFWVRRDALAAAARSPALQLKAGMMAGPVFQDYMSQAIPAAATGVSGAEAPGEAAGIRPTLTCPSVVNICVTQDLACRPTQTCPSVVNVCVTQDLACRPSAAHNCMAQDLTTRPSIVAICPSQYFACPSVLDICVTRDLTCRPTRTCPSVIDMCTVSPWMCRSVHHLLCGAQGPW
jgi:hypothetical protein